MPLRSGSLPHPALRVVGFGSAAIIFLVAGCSNPKTVAPVPQGANTASSVQSSEAPVTLDLGGSTGSVGRSVNTAGTAAPAAGATTEVTGDTAATTSIDSSAPKVAAAWTNDTNGLVGLPSECGNLSLVSARPDAPTLVASVAQQGLWTLGGGQETWSALGTGAGSAHITNRGTSVVYDPSASATYWETGIYNGGGVYRTDDNGMTFRQLGNIVHTEAVGIDFTDPARRTLLATKHEAPVVSRSTDGGKSWTDISSALPVGIGFATGPVVIDANTFVLGTSNGAQAGVFRSTDAGSTWTRVFDTGVTGRPLVASDGGLYWVSDTNNTVIKSTDGGATWSVVSTAGGQAPKATSLVELANGALVTIGNTTLIISEDQGATWQSFGPALPFPPTGIVYSAFLKAIYIWHFDCDFATKDPIQPNSIVRLDVDAAVR